MRHLLLPKIESSRSRRAVPAVESLTVESIIQGYDQREFLPSDVIMACIERIARLEPTLNVFITINDYMLEEADRADTEILNGQRRGRLHGVPVIIKDNTNQIGFRTTAGYAGFASNDRIVDFALGTFNGIDLFPEQDATIVTRLKKAGAIIVGKSNLPDFGLDGLRADSSHNGDSLNPYGATLAPGASSTGSSTGVAAGFAPISIGTDTAGSILFPASAQSLVGLKPSFGLVPIDGVFPGLASHHDVAGPIATCVYDVAVLLEVLAGPTPDDPRTEAAVTAGDNHNRAYVKGLQKGALRGKVVGLFESGQWAGELHPDVLDHYNRMVQIIETLGARTLPVVFGDTDWATRWEERTFFASCNSYWAAVDAYLANLGGSNPDSCSAFKKRAGFDIGLATTAPLFSLLANPKINVADGDPKLKVVVEQAVALRMMYEKILAQKSIDLLFVPRSIAPLPNLSADTLGYLGDQVVGTQVNEMGLPAITIPAGFLADGRPIAVDFVGRARFTEADLLAYAYDFEQATLFRRPPEFR